MIKIKLDENMPTSAVSLCRQKGHDVHTVFDEALNGGMDEKIAESCCKEYRVLITLDTDFSDIRAYPPKDYAGIVLLRPHRQSEPQVIKLLESVLPMFQTEPVHGFLWIVESAGVRIR